MRIPASQGKIEPAPLSGDTWTAYGATPQTYAIKTGSSRALYASQYREHLKALEAAEAELPSLLEAHQSAQQDRDKAVAHRDRLSAAIRKAEADVEDAKRDLGGIAADAYLGLDDGDTNEAVRRLAVATAGLEELRRRAEREVDTTLIHRPHETEQAVQLCEGRIHAQKRWLESRPALDKIDWTTVGFEADGPVAA